MTKDIEEAQLVDAVVEPEKEEERHYFLAAIKVGYLRKDKPKEKTVNVMLDTPYPFVTQSALQDFTRGACQQVIENINAKPEDLREAVILSISHLGRMLPSIFKTTIKSDISNEQAN